MYSLVKTGIKLGLDNIKSLLDFYQIDYQNLPVVHVAGTNGKGSTCRILTEILQQSGYKVGLFTSPHISVFNERIAINGKIISSDELKDLTDFFKEGIGKFNCTFFEASTAIGLKYFIDKKVDIAIIEVGLGGRFDSTNLVNPLQTAITSIAYDHLSFLGNSLIEIAREKAGIIKRGRTLVINSRKKWLIKFFNKMARKKCSKVINAADFKLSDISENSVRRTLFYFNGQKVDCKFNLKGSYQKSNLKTALVLAKNLKRENHYRNITVETIIRALKIIYVPGRMDLISKKPDIMLDAAHNLQGLQKLKTDLFKIYRENKYDKIILLFGTVKDKNYIEVLSFVAGFDFAAEINFTEFTFNRTLKHEIFEKIRNEKSLTKLNSYNSVELSYNEIKRNLTNQSLLVVTGSHFLLGEFLEVIKK